MGLMTLPAGHLLSKLPFQSLSVSVPLTVRPLGIHLLFAVPFLHHLLMTGITNHKDLPAPAGVRAGICPTKNILTETEKGAETRGVIMTIDGLEKEAMTIDGLEKEVMTIDDLEKEVMTIDDLEKEVMMIDGLEKEAEEIMMRVAVMGVGIIENLVLTGAEAAAAAAARAGAFLVRVNVQIYKQAPIEMEVRIRGQHRAIWQSLEICMVT